MKKQTHKDRMDEHLGEKHPGKHKESMKDRRHEMMGMMKKEKAKKMAKKK